MSVTRVQLKNRLENAIKVVEKMQRKTEYHKRIINKRYNKAVVKADKCAKLTLQMQKEGVGKILF